MIATTPTGQNDFLSGS